MAIFHAINVCSIFSSNLEHRRSIKSGASSFSIYIYKFLLSYASWSMERNFEKKQERKYNFSSL